MKKHLLIIQEQTEERFDLLVGQMAKREGVTEQLKAKNQMLWVKRVNNIRERAEEIVEGRNHIYADLSLEKEYYAFMMI